MNKETKNYYEILEIPVSSSSYQIQEGYIRTKNAYSGESVALYSLLTKAECDDILDQIETAFSVLSVPNKRKEYDRIKGLNQERNIPYDSNYQDNGNFEDLDRITVASDGLVSKGSSLQDPNSPYANQNNNALADNYSGSDYRDFKINRNDVLISKITAQKRFSLHYEKRTDFEQQIENSTVFPGEFLKNIREYKNVTLDRMADLTKISKTYIKYIENEEIDKLPALAYVRGFVYQYAKILKLNPDLVATSYMHHIKNTDSKRP